MVHYCICALQTLENVPKFILPPRSSRSASAPHIQQTTIPACNLTGLWKWTSSSSLDIQIAMTGNDTFLVTLHPDQDWHNATGLVAQWWNGTAGIAMKSATGLEMDGYVTDACNIITCGVHAGSWVRHGTTPTPTPKPPPPSPPAPPPSHGGPDVVWDTPSADVLGSMPLGNGKLGVNVWADDTSAIGLLLSHVDALDENANLDKLGRIMQVTLCNYPPHCLSQYI